MVFPGSASRVSSAGEDACVEDWWAAAASAPGWLDALVGAWPLFGRSFHNQGHWRCNELGLSSRDEFWHRVPSNLPEGVAPVMSAGTRRRPVRRGRRPAAGFRGAAARKAALGGRRRALGRGRSRLRSRRRGDGSARAGAEDRARDSRSRTFADPEAKRRAAYDVRCGSGAGCRRGIRGLEESRSDASAYAGIRFAGKGPAELTLQFSTIDTVERKYGGLCDTDCDHPHRIRVRLTDRFQTHEVRFHELAQAPDVPPRARRVLDLGRLKAFAFVVDAGSESFDFWIDDVEWIAQR